VANVAHHAIRPEEPFSAEIALLIQQRDAVESDRLGFYRNGDQVSVENARIFLRRGLPAKWSLVRHLDRRQGFVLRLTSELDYEAALKAAWAAEDDDDDFDLD
jgi:hypothetical protein